MTLLYYILGSKYDISTSLESIEKYRKLYESKSDSDTNKNNNKKLLVCILVIMCYP